MSRWKHSVELKDLLEIADDADLTDDDVNHIGNKIHERISKLECFNDFDIIDEFKEVYDIEDFDNIIEELYDYADYNRIWIE